MSTEQQILVRGEAERQAPADIAGLTIVVQVNDAEQDQAFAKASEIAAAVDLVLDDRSDALGARQAAVVVVRPTVRWNDGEEQRTGWQALRTTSLDLTDLSLVTLFAHHLGGPDKGPHLRAGRQVAVHQVHDPFEGFDGVHAGQARWGAPIP